MKKMLLIGNGVSRLQDYVIQYINDWEDDIWIFNLGYLDFGKRATRWSGHKELIEVVYQYKQFHKAKYIIYTNEITDIPHNQFSHEELYDSGSTAVKQALLEGFDCYLVGFDLGGADVYSPGHEKLNKIVWVERMYYIWRRNKDRVHFIGIDHSEVFAKKDFSYYYRKYNPK